MYITALISSIITNTNRMLKQKVDYCRWAIPVTFVGDTSTIKTLVLIENGKLLDFFQVDNALLDHFLIR